MATSDISDNLSGLKIAKDQDINILLLGETGVGKSTFINSLANYLLFKSYKKAAKGKLHVLIPAQFTVTNKLFEQITINVGASDENEFREFGAAATQNVKTYVFPIGEGKTRLRVIDTPGMGDPRGVEQDDVNCENILAYLAQLQELHAICFLMKPTNTRLTVLFEYCVKQILSRLEKSASRNIIFIFTNTRGTNYAPGETLPLLRKVVEDIKAQPPHVDIPLKTNVFCLDNEAFRYLVATQQNVEFDELVQARFVDSWKNSSTQCWKLISYIVGDASSDPLKPHQLKNTISINEARRVIVQLSQPLADITQLIHDNIRILDRHQTNLRMENQSMEELKKKLYIPTLDLEVTQLTQPVTVCTSSKCAEIVPVGELRKWHFRQRCHDPCYLTDITKEMIGDPGLINCAAMNGGRICQKCTCDYSVHQHIYYMTRTVGSKTENKVVKDNISIKEQAVKEARRLMGEIDKRKIALEEERDTIIKSTAQFAHFLQNNAISPFNDSYKSYIEYLIKREQGLGPNSDKEAIYNLQQLMRQYDEIKKAFDATLNANKQLGLGLFITSFDTADSIFNTIQKLYQLPNNGKKIQELLKKQKAPRKSEYNSSCEYIHPKMPKPKKEKSKTDDEKKHKSKGKSTDDERKKKKPANTNFGKGPQQQQQQIPSLMSRDAPPPYESFQHQPRRQYRNNDDDSGLCVKVEVVKNKNYSRPMQSQQFQARQHPSQNQRGFHPPPNQFYQNQGPQGYVENPGNQRNYPPNPRQFSHDGHYPQYGGHNPQNPGHFPQNRQSSGHFHHDQGRQSSGHFHQDHGQCQQCLDPGSFSHGAPHFPHGPSHGHLPGPQHSPQPGAFSNPPHFQPPNYEPEYQRPPRQFTQRRNFGPARGYAAAGGRGGGGMNKRGKSQTRKGRKSGDEKSRRRSSSSSSSSSDSSD